MDLPAYEGLPARRIKALGKSFLKRPLINGWVAFGVAYIRCSFSFWGRLEGFRVRGILGAYSPFPARRIRAWRKSSEKRALINGWGIRKCFVCRGTLSFPCLLMDWVFACFAVRDLSAISDAAALSFVEDSLNSHLKAPYRRFLCEPYFRYRGMF